jgi:hypothetical protein
VLMRSEPARDLLSPYGDGVIVLSTMLRIKRTPDAAEIDKWIAEIAARNAGAPSADAMGSHH